MPNNKPPKSKRFLSIYVHIPFCEKRCPYCDFHSNAGASVAETEVYIDRLCQNIEKTCAERKSVLTDYLVNTVYIGGGTPSSVDAKFIAKILDCVRRNFTLMPDAEISIECNPNSMTADKMEIYRAAGINRISIGVQSFNNKGLKILGRVHNARQAKAAVRLAVQYFDNVNIDLIHSVPNGKNNKPIRVTLPRKYLALVQHVSAYCLTSDKYPRPDEDKSIKQQTAIERTLAKCGFEKYEISNFAKEGFACRHNLVYWQCGEWFGFGDSAASHFAEPWTSADRIMLGLRLTQGIPAELLADRKEKVARLIALGLLKIGTGGGIETNYGTDDGGVARIACTPRGFLLHNRVLGELI